MADDRYMPGESGPDPLAGTDEAAPWRCRDCGEGFVIGGLCPYCGGPIREQRPTEKGSA